MNKRWRFKNTDVNTEKINLLINKANISRETATVMLSRGIDENTFDTFLNGGMGNFHNPFLMKDMENAVNRILFAKENNECITVYGDYDVDGISATVLLVRFFKSMGMQCDYYIPDRETEGYGVNKDAIKKIANKSTTLIVTVDTGITAIEEVQYAKSVGVDMIITDHHTPKEEIPDAVAVINPKQRDCEYPFKELSGTGVAFKLACAISGDCKKMVIDYADIVALATVADVVSLMDENRIITSLGLRKIRKMPSPAIRAIIKLAGTDISTVQTQHIGFYIAPRINAAGRMGNAGKAVEMFLTDDENDIFEYAKYLNDKNEERKQNGEKLFRRAVDEIEEKKLYNNKVIVLANYDWHHGIIGIIASRLSEMYCRNVILISLDLEYGKGSGRAVAGFNLFEALCAVSDDLLKFGGHALAAGLTIDKEKIEKFDMDINEYADKVISFDDMIPVVDIDAETDCSTPLIKLYEEMEMLEPFGTDNERPVLAVFDAEAVRIRTDKSGKHLFVKIKKENTYIDCVGFGKGNMVDAFSEGDRVDIAAHLNKNIYGNNITIQFHIVDIREAKCNTHTKN